MPAGKYIILLNIAAANVFKLDIPVDIRVTQNLINAVAVNIFKLAD